MSLEETTPVPAPPGGDDPPPADDALGERAEQWWTRGAVVVLVVLLVIGGFLVGRRTAGPPAGDVDTGFLVDMSRHHEQAVEMALIELQRGSDPEARDFAQEVILFQRWELGKMDAMLAERDEVPPPPDPGREAMGWMGAPVPLAQMPGLATEDQLDQLRLADGPDADLIFLELMTAHHQGGLPMADYAAGRAADPDIRTLAEVMARNQRAEIPEYARAMTRLRALGATGLGG